MARAAAPAPEPKETVGLGLWHRVMPFVIPLGVLVLWQLATMILGRSLGPFFPAPTVVAQSLLDWATGYSGVTAVYSGKMIFAILDSLRRVITALALAICIGIPLGVLVGWLRPVQRLVDPAMQLIRPVPVTAWVPLSMLWFGIGDGAAIYLIVLATVFPIYINTVQGVRYVNPIVVRAGRMLGAADWRLLIYVVLPAALPTIFAGLRIAFGFAWMAVVVSELVAVKNGLGYVMFEAYGFLRADIVIAAMVVIGTLGFITDWLMVLLEKRLLRWAAVRS